MPKHPPRGRSLFRQYNAVKLLRSAKEAGLEIGGVEVTKDGTIRVLTKKTAEHNDALDQWIATKDAHSA